MSFGKFRIKRKTVKNIRESVAEYVMKPSSFAFWHFNVTETERCGFRKYASCGKCEKLDHIIPGIQLVPFYHFWGVFYFAAFYYRDQTNGGELVTKKCERMTRTCLGHSLILPVFFSTVPPKWDMERDRNKRGRRRRTNRVRVTDSESRRRKKASEGWEEGERNGTGGETKTTKT